MEILLVLTSNSIVETGQSASGAPSGLEWTNTASDEQYDHTSSQIAAPAWSSMSRAVPNVHHAGPSTLPDEPASPFGSCPSMSLQTLQHHPHLPFPPHLHVSVVMAV
ncbi:hypothetical protein Tco_0466635 [Tanacetum coccineum]